MKPDQPPHVHRRVINADSAAIASGDFNRWVNKAPSSSITWRNC